MVMILVLQKIKSNSCLILKKNVFINCPFDDAYRNILLIPLIFTVKYLGYKPRLSLENDDSSQTRIDKIVSFIDESKFGIHDLSRIMSKDRDESFRMNMPFELGIDFGCKKFKEGMWENKKILVLEKEKYRYQKALSDLSGSDIKHHNDDPILIIKRVRDWFVVVESLSEINGGPKIWMDYNDFQTYMYNEFVDNLGHASVDDIPIPEVIQCMSNWISINVFKDNSVSKKMKEQNII